MSPCMSRGSDVAVLSAMMLAKKKTETENISEVIFTAFFCVRKLLTFIVQKNNFLVVRRYFN